MKGHTGTITFGAKNFYGTNGIKPNWQDNGNRHPAENALTNYMTNAHSRGRSFCGPWMRCIRVRSLTEAMGKLGRSSV